MIHLVHLIERCTKNSHRWCQGNVTYEITTKKEPKVATIRDKLVLPSLETLVSQHKWLCESKKWNWGYPWLFNGDHYDHI